VLRYLDCGLFENGFASIRCPDCAEDYLLAFSCKTRELCPSCAAKRSAVTAVRRGVQEILSMDMPQAYRRQEEIGGPLRRWQDAREGQRAFVEMRKPVFHGR